MIACFTITSAIVVVLIDKTPVGTAVLLVLMAGTLSYPIFHLPWVVGTTGRQKALRITILLILALGAVTIAGVTWWPTSKLHIIKWEIIPVSPNKHITVNLHCRNDGHDVTIQIFYKIAWVDAVPPDEASRNTLEDRLWEEFKKNPQNVPPTDVPEAEETWTSLFGESLTPDQAQKITAPGVNDPTAPGIYVMGRVHFLGLVTERDVTFCNFFQNDVRVFVKCVSKRQP
jgi:hypothetical protein